MAKEKKIFGAEEKAPVEKDIFDDVEDMEGVQDITATSSDELIAQLTAEAAQKSQNRKKKKINEYKAQKATRDALFSRLGKLSMFL